MYYFIPLFLHCTLQISFRALIVIKSTQTLNEGQHRTLPHILSQKKLIRFASQTPGIPYPRKYAFYPFLRFLLYTFYLLCFGSRGFNLTECSAQERTRTERGWEQPLSLSLFDPYRMLYHIRPATNDSRAPLSGSPRRSSPFPLSATLVRPKVG